MQQGDSSSYHGGEGDAIVQNAPGLIQTGDEATGTVAGRDVNAAPPAAAESPSRIAQILQVIAGVAGIAVAVLTATGDIDKSVGIPIAVLLIGGPSALKLLKPGAG